MRDMATTAERLTNHLKDTLIGTDINNCPDALDVFFNKVDLVDFDTEDMTGNGEYIMCNVYECIWTDPERTFMVRVYYKGLRITEVYVDEYTD